MFSNVSLDVFISLIFVFLLYSLLATIVQEAIANQASLRNRNLLRAIRSMLDDHPFQNPSSAFWDRMLDFLSAFKNAIVRYFNPLPNGSLTKAFYAQPSIRQLRKSRFRNKPSFIDPANFSQTLIRMLRGPSYDGSAAQMSQIQQTLFSAKNIAHLDEILPIGAGTLGHLQQLFIDAQHDIDRYRQALENWFNETMDRASEWYKEQTQIILFLIGLFLAITFNIDSIAIYRTLRKDKDIRDQMVQLAIHTAPTYQGFVDSIKKAKPVYDSTHHIVGYMSTDSGGNRISNALMDSAYSTLQKDQQAAGNILGLGWENQDSCKACQALKKRLRQYKKKDPMRAVIQRELIACKKQYHCKNPYQGGFGEMLAGWVITALAISLGAPFWFDLLSKFVQVRALKNSADGPASPSPASSSGPDTSGNTPVVPPDKRVG